MNRIATRQLRTIVLDWDDTINDTYGALCSAVSELGGTPPKTKVYLSKENCGPALGEVLSTGAFMSIHRPRPHYAELVDALTRLQSAEFSRVVICTHRGYLANAEYLSTPALAQLGWHPDEVWYLDPKEYPDKTEFLSQQYPEGYVLFDDRPAGFGIPEYPQNVVLVQQPWSAQSQDFLATVTTLKEAAALLQAVPNPAVMNLLR